jgi:phytoene desaturase
MSKRVAIIGSGFSGLSAACYLAKNGFDVTIYEKNKNVGGRANTLKEKGYTFDMGPSWYWMPDVFENFFHDFGFKVSDFYELERLDPGYRVFFSESDHIDVSASLDKIKELFESLEQGSSEKLDLFLKDAKGKYDISFKDFINLPNHSALELLKVKNVKHLKHLDISKSVSSLVHKYFKHEKIINLLEFPVLFLGAKATKIPALYTLMNYADFSLGTWYPKGGMYSVVLGFEKLAENLGVKIITNSNVDNIECYNEKVIGVKINNTIIESDYVIGSADYHHIESKLLPKKYRNYSEPYWEKRVMAPSSILFYIGINKKLTKLEHHNLIFDEDFELHSNEIYTNPKWPTKPRMYISMASKTDKTVAPENSEAIVGLIPVAVGLSDTKELREKYSNLFINKLESISGEKIRGNIEYIKTYAHSDFIEDYNAFKGNAYGLANILKQTAFFKPKIKNKKLKNLYYCGQLTVPGPGVPPSIISGKIIANEIMKDEKKK